MTDEAKKSKRGSVVFSEAVSGEGNDVLSLLEKKDPRKVDMDTKAIHNLVATMKASIPENIFKDISAWPVGHAAITKAAKSKRPSLIPNSSNIHPITKDRRASQKFTRMGTSKVRKFKPAATFDDALSWLAEYGEADSSLVFENHCSLQFEAAKFADFDDVRDPEDENEDENEE